MIRPLPGVVLLLLLTGCAAKPPATTSDASCCITPMEAILKAAETAPKGVQGIFEMPVTAYGIQDKILYLNSEEDYRDQRNLTVVVPPKIQRDLAKRLGENYITQIKGRTIRIPGEAKRVRIEFTAFSLPTGKYYYQTHVLLDDATKLKIVP